MQDLKYLLAYIAPLSAFMGLYFQGIAAPGAFYIAFIFIPLVEFFISGSNENLNQEQESNKNKQAFFDILLYLNVPILFALLYFFFYTLNTTELNNFELFFSCLNMGIIVSTIGINVAHELGHRSTRIEQFLSKLLLTTALYTHFFIEHNRGHHKNVATDIDPASARLNENLYAFWIRSILHSYKNAWKLENNRLRKIGQGVFNLNNEMIVLQSCQLIYLVAIGLLFGVKAICFAMIIALIGILLLETVNYIEHYGLRRKKLANGKYETVQPWHSWNSNHDLGRIYLYELTRHADHHFKATRKYQVLRHFEDSPQLPLGYPGSMLLSTIPPLWFRVMNKRALTFA